MFKDEINVTTELTPMFDSRQSFYRKAFVTYKGNTQELHSYGSHVATISGGEVTLRTLWNSSATTLRHVKEFLKQNGFTAVTKVQIAKDYA